MFSFMDCFSCIPQFFFKEMLGTVAALSVIGVLFIFRDREREGEREGEKHQCVVASCAPPTEDLARNPGMYPDWDSNP